MDTAGRRITVAAVVLVGVLVLLLVLAAGLVRAQADQGPPTGVRRPVAVLVEGGWGYGWCRCSPTGDVRP